jgi:hypothetical protein
MHKIVWGAAAANDKTKEIETKKLIEARDRVLAINKEMKTVNPDGGIGRTQRADLKRERNKLVGEMKQRAEWFKPQNQMDHLNEQAAQLEQVAQSLAYDPDNSLMVQTYLKSAANKRAEAALIGESELAKAKAIADANKPAKPMNPNYMTEEQYVKGFARGYGSKDAMGQMITDPINVPKVRMMEEMGKSLDMAAGKNPAVRMKNQTDIREFVELRQKQYLSKVRDARTMNAVQLKQQLKLLNDKGWIKLKSIPKGVPNLKKKVNEGYFKMFQFAMRDKVKNPKLLVYKPRFEMDADFSPMQMSQAVPMEDPNILF